ncbi:UDP-N-acetylmuramoyl-L-alanyl-D-glutamate--2,6-diaminopimelate ligase [Ornithinibacillus xuwenensis]|uniref:UDP-N-acetylmuramyl-tripeptide synthetase n=1 Tax=Ornithinibacillus xuwenensis TaxID=3144668 RepID=A0ABU9XKU8_9BACI
MLLRDLLRELSIHTNIDQTLSKIEVKGIADNSKDVKPGYVFIAIKGFTSDGHDYITDAIQNGATIIIGDQSLNLDVVPYIKVDNSRQALGIISKNYYQNPSKDKIMIGITGTNGKTTTSYILKHLLEQNGKSCSIIGTIQNIVNGETLSSSNTTPSVLMLNKLLSECKDEIVIVEVSSHGLTQFRVEGIQFDFGIFTNLYHEHLDYHSTMEEYFQAKLLLFDHLKENGLAIINKDNYWGEKLVSILNPRGIKAYTIGQSSDNDIQLLDLATNTSTISAKAESNSFEMVCPMPGTHNKYNTMLAFLTARSIGIPQNLIQQSMMSFQGVNGRFETIRQEHTPTVIIDYAHTPDAVFHCITSAKNYGAKRVIHVFGFRGNRDKTKRPEMLAITSDLSDCYILTLDDLNNVSEEEMIETLEELNRSYGNHKGMIIPDRTLAIQKAIEMANDEDWVMITGKGHENYQQDFHLNTFSDKDTVQAVLHEFTKQEIFNSN